MRNNDHSSEQSPPSSPYRHYQDDEIDLIDIWRILVKRWRLIATITLTCTVLAVVYALLAPRVYQAEAFILPPQFGDIEQLNISVVSSDNKGAATSRVSTMSVEDVYGETIKNLQSLSVRRLFFDAHDLFDQLKEQDSGVVSEHKVFTKAFHQRLTVTQGKKDRADFVTVSLKGKDPGLITAWLNSFLTMVNGYTVDILVQDLYANLTVKKESIENNINALRQVAKNRRLDRIAALQEALSVATQLGLEQRANLSSPSSHPKNNSEFGVAVNTADTPLYLRGVRELQAEIDTLQKRKSDDPFIESLRTLQEELSQIKQIQVEPDKIKAFRLDQEGMVPEVPVEPNRKLIVALGSVLGLMLGVFAAFFVNFIETARRQDLPA